MTSYQAMDSISSNHVASALGIRLNYSLDIMGGGSSTEALVMNVDRAAGGRMLRHHGGVSLHERPLEPQDGWAEPRRPGSGRRKPRPTVSST